MHATNYYYHFKLFNHYSNHGLVYEMSENSKKFPHHFPERDAASSDYSFCPANSSNPHIIEHKSSLLTIPKVKQ